MRDTKCGAQTEKPQIEVFLLASSKSEPPRRGKSRWLSGKKLITILLLLGVMVSCDDKKSELEKSMLASLKTVKVGLGVYYKNHSKYPSKLDELLEDQGSLLIKIPEDIFSPGNKVRYHLNTENTGTYVVFSVGKDGEAQVTGVGNNTILLNSGGDDIYMTNAKYTTVYDKQQSGQDY